MERLTGRDTNAGTPYYKYCFEKPCLGMGCANPDECTHSLAACERLAEYEDTGITPGQVKCMSRIQHNNGYTNIEEMLLVIPARGRWIPYEGYIRDTVECSECEWERTAKQQKNNPYAYCPNCGCKMEVTG